MTRADIELPLIRLHRSISRCLPKEAHYDDLIVLFITIAFLTRQFWVRFLVKTTRIPHEFWYEIPQSSTTQALSRGKKAEGRNIAKLFTESQLNAIIFWGSQSGRAELLARQFARDLQDRYKLQALAADLDDFDFEHLSQLKQSQLCGFVLSTYGDGDPPDNANGLWNFLHSASKHGTNLGSMRYMIFGLGNSNYRQYNNVAETVDSLLGNLGAVRLGRMSAGDDAQGKTEAHFLSWRHEIYHELETTLGLKKQKHSYQVAFDIRYDRSIDPRNVSLGEPHLPSPTTRYGALRTAEPKQPTPVLVTKAQKLWETGERLCLNMDLNLGEDRKLKYKTGDHLAIWPCNHDHEVQRLTALMGYIDKDHLPIRIASVNQHGHCRPPVPTLTTVDSLLRHYLEISGRLSLETIRALSEFAPSESAAARLRGIGENASELRTMILARHMSLADILEKVAADSQWNIPLSFLLERLKPMQPRYYSISSSASVQPQIASVTIVVDKPPSTENSHCGSWQGCYGLATCYLSAVEKFLNGNKQLDPDVSLSTHDMKGPRGVLEGGKLFCNVRQSSFKLPTKSSSPIIMVGAGTGVAPFRAFVQERVHRKKLGEEVGKMLLFMGFRNAEIDFIYEREWLEWRKTIGLGVFKYATAFSRDDENNRLYVQHLIQNEKEEVMELLDTAGCRFFICGSASMARDVIAVLSKIRVEVTGEKEDQAIQWIRQLRQHGTLLEDVWN